MTILRFATCLLVTGFLVVLQIWGATRNDNADFAACAQNLELPRYVPPIGPTGRMGPILVKVRLGSAGQTRSVSVEGGSETAASLLRSTIADSAFASSCAGK